MRITPVNRAIIPPTHQADAVLSQVNPVSGTEYTVLDTTRNVRVISMTASCEWTVQPNPLELHLTIDGNALTFAGGNPVSGTNHKALIIPYLNEASQGLTPVTVDYRDSIPYFLFEGRSVKVTAEITGGTVQSLVARVKYAKW